MKVTARRPIAVQLQQQGVLLLDASELLVKMFGDLSSDSKSLATTISEISQEGSKLVHSLLNRLNSMAVKPVDRNLYYNVSQVMDGIFRLLESVSSRSVLFKLNKPIPFTAEMADTVSQQARAIAAALSGLRNGGPAPDHCEEIIRLRDEVDRLHESSIFNLFQEVKDPIELIKRKQVIDELAKASRAARDVGYILRPLTYRSAAVH